MTVKFNIGKLMMNDWPSVLVVAVAITLSGASVGASEPESATGATPADGGYFIAGTTNLLSWTPGKSAIKQNVYFGTSAAEVLASTKPVRKDLSATVTSILLPVAKPVAGQTFYWRVESLNHDGNRISPGEVWRVRVVGRKLRVYLLAGQSNMSGCTSVKGVPKELLGWQKNVIIYMNSGSQTNITHYGWDFLKDGLGDSYGNVDKLGSFGPELTFGRDMSARYPNDEIALIKVARGGTILNDQWRPPSAGGKVGELYQLLVSTVQEGIAKLDPAFQPEISGMIWMQGETDAITGYAFPAYETNLTCFINDIRAEFKKPALPFVIGEISTGGTYNPPNRGAEVRQAQRNVAQNLPHCASFPTGDRLWDPWHYNATAMIKIGEDFAAAMVALEKKQATK